MSINFNATSSYSNWTTALSSPMINDIVQELKLAITNNNYDRIKELLDRELDVTVSSKLVSDSLLSLQEHDLSQARAIFHSNSFEEMPTQDVKKILYKLVDEKKLKILELLINTNKVYEIQQELFNELESAIMAGDNDLAGIILNCSTLEELPEERIENCFKKAKKTENLSILETLLNHRKVSFLPSMVSQWLITAIDEKEVRIAISIVNSKKFFQISTEDLEIALSNAVSKKTNLIEILLNSRRSHEFSLDILSELASRNEGVQTHYNNRLHFSNFHEGSDPYKPSFLLDFSTFHQDYRAALTMLNCKECNNAKQLPITDLESFLAGSIGSVHTLEIVNAVLNADRMHEISDGCFKKIIDFFLAKDRNVIQRLMSVDLERTKKCAFYVFQQALNDRYEEKIKNFFYLFPDVEVNLLPSLIAALKEENNLSLIETFLSTNKITNEDLAFLTHSVISNEQVNTLHKLVSCNKFIRENLQSILESHFPDFSPLYVSALDYVIKNNLPQLTKTILSIDKPLKETFPTSTVIEHAIENDHPEILIKILQNSSLWGEEEAWHIIDYATTKNQSELLRATLTAASFSSENLVPILHSLTRQNYPKLLEILLSMSDFSEENLLSSLPIALEVPNRASLAILSSCQKISRENLLPILQYAVEQEETQTISAISCSNYILFSDLQPVFEDAIKKSNLGMIKALLSCNQFSKEYISGMVTEAIESKNLPVLKILITSNHYEQSDISFFLNSIAGNIAMTEVFFTLLTSSKLDQNFLDDLLNQNNFVNSMSKLYPRSFKSIKSTDASFCFDHALHTKNQELMKILLTRTNHFPKEKINEYVRNLIKEKNRIPLKTLLSFYEYTREDLETFKNESSEDLKGIFNRKIGSMLSYIS